MRKKGEWVRDEFGNWTLLKGAKVNLFVNENDLAETLKRAETILDHPGKWTREVFARDAEGFEDSWQSDKACSYCLTGAIMKAALDVSGHDPGNWDGDKNHWSDLRTAAEHAVIDAILDLEIAMAIGFESLEAFNDARGVQYRDVAGALREARIAAEEAQALAQEEA